MIKKTHKIIGVYIIANTINNKRYIGSSVDIQKRFRTHKRTLNQNIHHNQHLQRAWNKYGQDNFKFEILETCTREVVKNQEQQYLIDLNPEYNISKDTKSVMMGRKHSQETLKLFKKRKVKRGKDNYMFGKTWSPEQRRKIIQARTGSKRSLCN